MDQVFQSPVKCGLDRFSPPSSVEWSGLWQTVQTVLQSAPACEKHWRETIQVKEAQGCGEENCEEKPQR
jgi:hypothetical protein